MAKAAKTAEAPKEKTVMVDGKYSIVANLFGTFDVRYDGNTMTGGVATKEVALAWLKANKLPELPKPVETPSA